MNKEQILKYAVIILAVACIFLLFQCFIISKQKKTAETSLRAQQVNEKVLLFNKMFVEKVLQTSNEVSFEDRLELENLVRSLNDSEILLAWQEFTTSATELVAEEKVRNLLVLLANKISY